MRGRSHFQLTSRPQQLLSALLAAMALSAAALPCSAAASTRTADAVANARLIVEGGYGAALAAVPNMAGDGRSALVIGLPYTDLPGRARAGVVHVVFATSRTGTVSIDDPALRGFRIIGGPYYQAGMAVAAAGDVNGDGRGDILLSAPRHGVRCTSPTDGPCGYKSPGTAFVIYGTSDQATVDLAHLTDSQGFAIKGIPGAAGAGSGGLAGLSDFTGDGFSAVAVTGAQYTRDGLHYRPGAYVIYGGRHLGTVDLQDLGSHGFRITSRDRSQSLLVSPAGRVNGDRRTDLLLDGPPTASVLFGARYRGTISAARLGRHGFTITGLAQGSGLPMTGVGDLNGDRRSDLLIVRSPIAPNGLPPAEVDVVYGSSSTRTVRLAQLGSRGFRMRPGPVAPGHTMQLGPVAALGDLNGDGRADLGITAITYPPGGVGPYDGAVSVVSGAPFAAPLSLGDLGSAGYQLTAATPPSPTPGCGSAGNRLGSGLVALGDFSGSRAPEFAIGAPGLAPTPVSAGRPCGGSTGEVLIEPPPAH